MLICLLGGFKVQKNIIMLCGGNSFLYKQIHKIKVNSLMKKCESLKERIKKNGLMEKEDRKINILAPNNTINKDEKVYIIVKGYNNDGSKKQTKKYTYLNDSIIEDKKEMKSEVSVLDLYEKSLYLYNSSKNDQYIEGYVIKEESKNSYNYSLVFTKEKVKVLIKNTNVIHEYPTVDKFVEKYYV